MNPTSDDIQQLTAAINALTELVHQIFAVPDSTLLAAAWSAGFTIPATVGLVAWMVAKLVSMFDN
jgi:hypothetical protein